MPDTPQNRPTNVAPPASRPAAPKARMASGDGAREDTTSERSATADKAAKAKEQASRWAEEAKVRGRDMLNQQKGGAADQLSKLASVLHQTADQCKQEEDQRSIGKALDQAASGLDRVAETIRERDVDAMLRQATDMVRRQPALFIGGAVAAGFLLTRFLKSSPPEDAHGREAYGGGYGSGAVYGTSAGPEPVGAARGGYVTSAHANPDEVRPGGAAPVTPSGRRDL